MPRPAVDAGNVYSLVPPEARGGDGEFWGVKWCAEVGKYLAPFVMQVGSGQLLLAAVQGLTLGAGSGRPDVCGVVMRS